MLEEVEVMKRTTIFTVLLASLCLFTVPSWSKEGSKKETTSSTTNDVMGSSLGFYSTSSPNTEAFTDGKMHIFFCGTGDPQVDMQNIRKPSCLAVVVDGEFFLIDAGEGAAQNLGQLGLPQFNIENIFITHWHSDHFAGLGYVNNVSWISGRKTPLNLWGPYGVDKIAESLNNLYELDVVFRAANRKNRLNPDYSKITPHLVNPSAGDPVFKTKNMTMSPFLVNHEPVMPAMGYEMQYKNCKIVVSGDTSVEADLIPHYSNADVLISEALSNYFGNIVKSKAEKSADKDESLAYYQETLHYHSDTLALAKLAAEHGVKQLFLTHLVPSIPPSEKAKAYFIKGMDEIYKKPITVADDQDELVIESVGGECKVTYKPALQPNTPVIQTQSVK